MESNLTPILSAQTGMSDAEISEYLSSMKDEDIEEIENFGDVSDDVSDEVLSEMNYNSVVEAIRSLPENYAEPLYLYHVRDMSVKDIAASLCTSEETVKKRLQRARQKLRTILEEQGITL